MSDEKTENTETESVDSYLLKINEQDGFCERSYYVFPGENSSDIIVHVQPSDFVGEGRKLEIPMDELKNGWTPCESDFHDGACWMQLRNNSGVIQMYIDIARSRRCNYEPVDLSAAFGNYEPEVKFYAGIGWDPDGNIALALGGDGPLIALEEIDPKELAGVSFHDVTESADPYENCVGKRLDLTLADFEGGWTPSEDELEDVACWFPLTLPNGDKVVLQFHVSQSSGEAMKVGGEYFDIDLSSLKIPSDSEIDEKFFSLVGTGSCSDGLFDDSFLDGLPDLDDELELSVELDDFPDLDGDGFDWFPEDDLKLWDGDGFEVPDEEEDPELRDFLENIRELNEKIRAGNKNAQDSLKSMYEDAFREYLLSDDDPSVVTEEELSDFTAKGIVDGFSEDEIAKA